MTMMIMIMIMLKIRPGGQHEVAVFYAYCASVCPSVRPSVRLFRTRSLKKKRRRKTKIGVNVFQDGIN